MPKIPPATGIH